MRLMLDLSIFPCSEAMSVHTRLANLTLVYLRVQRGLHPLYANEETSVTASGIPRNVELYWWCTLRANTILALIWDYPNIATVVYIYLIYKQSNRMYTQQTISK